MQALSSHYEIYKRVFLHPLMASKLLLVVRAGGGDDDLLRRTNVRHSVGNAAALRYLTQRRTIKQDTQSVSVFCPSGSPLRRERPPLP